jgi:hypothetical protein
VSTLPKRLLWHSVYETAHLLRRHSSTLPSSFAFSPGRMLGSLQPSAHVCRFILSLFSRTPGPPVASAGIKITPPSSSVARISSRVFTVVPSPFSYRLTVFAATPARLPRSRTPQPSAARAILTCKGVIITATIVDIVLESLYTVPIAEDMSVAWMTTPIVKNEVHRYQWLREKLLESFPGIDDETIRDTLEGITDLHEMVAEIIRSALIDEALQGGLKSRLEDMRRRLSRLEERCAKKRQLALDAMSEVGLRKLEQPDFTASARSGSPSLVIVAEEAIPSPYWVPQPPKLDRQTLLAELKRGREVPGTQLSNPRPTLSVRTK